jgi:hypothetical protein
MRFHSGALLLLGALLAWPAAAHAAPDTFADLRTAEGVPDVAEEAFALSVKLDGPVAEVSAKQTLRNRGKEDHEVIYRFPLAADAAVTGLSVKMYGGKVAEGIVVDAAAAIEPLPDPANIEGAPDVALLREILTTQGHTVYELRVYPVPAGKSIEVTTTWIAPLRYDGGRLSLRVPSRGGAANLAVPQVSLSVNAPPGARGLGEVAGGGKVLASEVKSGKGSWRFAAPPEDDLVIEVAPRFGGSSQPVVSAATHTLADGHGLIALSVLVPPPTAAEIPHYDRVVFFVDTSRSMSDSGARAARTVVQSVLGSLPAETRVEAVLFDRKARRVFGGWGANDRDGRKKVDQAIADAPQDNGSDLGAALALARPILGERSRDELALQKKTGVRPNTLVVIVSDGIAPLALTGDRAVDRYGVDLLEHAFIVSVTLFPEGGVAPAVDEAPAGVLATRAGGRSVVMRDVDAPQEGARLAAELAQPAPLRALSLDSGVAVIDDLGLPGELAPGQGVVVMAATVGELPKKLVLKGRLGGEQVAIAVRAAPAGLARALAPLWLRRSGPDGMVSLADRGLGADERDSPHGKEVAAKALHDYQKVAQGVRVVSPTTALVALSPVDGFSRDRAKFVEKWGPARFQRFLPPSERLAGLAPEAPPPPVDEEAVRAQTRAFVATGELDEKIVKRLMQTYVVPQARACFQKALRVDPRAAGAIDLVVEMSRGEVTAVRIAASTFKTADVDLCVIDAAYGMQVPRVGLGDVRDVIVVARYPMTFKAKEDGAASVSDEKRAPAAPVDPK